MRKKNLARRAMIVGMESNPLHIREADVLGGTAQGIAAAAAPVAAHDAGLFQFQKDLFQELLGYVCSVSNLGNLDRLAIAAGGQNQQGTKGIMGFLGQHVSIIHDYPDQLTC